MSAHLIRTAIDELAREIANRCSKEGFEMAEKTGALAQIPPGHDYGHSIVKRHAVETLTDWLLGDIK
jgi:hypothetical protein